MWPPVAQVRTHTPVTVFGHQVELFTRSRLLPDPFGPVHNLPHWHLPVHLAFCAVALGPLWVEVRAQLWPLPIYPVYPAVPLLWNSLLERQNGSPMWPLWNLSPHSRAHLGT